MKAIYFPFIDISEASLAAMNAFFGQAVLYLPSRVSRTDRLTQWAAEERIAIVEPFSGDESQFETLLKEYRNWGYLHEKDKGLKAAMTRLRKEGQPFYDDNAVSRIRSDILGDSVSRFQKPAQSPLLQDRVFLHMTRMYDDADREIQADMEELSSMEKRLHEAMGTEVEPTTRSALPVHDPGGFMTTERLRSWSRLFLHDAGGGPFSAVFATDSRAVFEHLLEGAPQTSTRPQKRLRLDPDAAAPDSLPVFSSLERIERSLRGEASMSETNHLSGEGENKGGENPESTLSVSLFIVEGVSPDRLFEAASTGKQLGTDHESSQDDRQGTILALLNHHFTEV